MTIFHFSSAIVMSEDKESANQLRTILQNLGIPFVHVFHCYQQTWKSINEDPDALLVLEWKDEFPSAQYLLENLSLGTNTVTRALLLWAPDQNQAILDEFLDEFSIDDVVKGNIDSEQIHQALLRISQLEHHSPSFRDKLRAAEYYRMEEMIQESEVLYQELLDQYPERVDLTIALADLYRTHGRFEEALGLVKESLEENDLNPKVLHYIGLLYWQKENADKALEFWNRAQEINPFHRSRGLLIGDALKKSGKEDEALCIWQELYEMDPNHQESARRYFGHLLESGQLETAVEKLRQLESKELAASVCNLAAVKLIRQERFGDALKIYQVAVSVLSEYPILIAKVAFNMGMIYYQSKALPQAARCFAIATVINPQHERARDNRNVLKAFLGSWQEPQEVQEAISCLETIA